LIHHRLDNSDGPNTDISYCDGETASVPVSVAEK